MIDNMKNSLAFNTLFIQAVEKHRCLYDHNDPQYSDREAQDRAWNLVATKVDGSVEECRAKWKNLRGGLTRYLKQSLHTSTSSKTVKKYYLLDVMKFLIPFTKTREYGSDVKNSITSSPTLSLDELENEMHGETTTYDDHISEDEVIIKDQDLIVSDDDNYSVESSPPQVRDKEMRKKRKLCAGDPLESSVSTYAPLTSTLTNPDLDFFRSILPDLAEFNPSQKRRFKQRVLQIIEDISNETVSTPSSSSTYPLNSYSGDPLHCTKRTSSPSTGNIDVKSFNKHNS